MRIAIALLLLSSISSAAQTAGDDPCGREYECLPKGGGHSVVVFPDGAYVPDAWIDQATDSASTWRKGSEKERNCALRVASMAIEIHAEQCKTEQGVRDLGNMRTSRDAWETQANTCSANNQMLTIKMGKRGTLNIVLAGTTLLFAATTVLLAIPPTP